MFGVALCSHIILPLNNIDVNMIARCLGQPGVVLHHWCMHSTLHKPSHMPCFMLRRRPLRYIPAGLEIGNM